MTENEIEEESLCILAEAVNHLYEISGYHATYAFHKLLTQLLEDKRKRAGWL